MERKYKNYARTPITPKDEKAQLQKIYKNLTFGIIALISFLILFSGISMAKVLGNPIEVQATGDVAKSILEIEKGTVINITDSNNSDSYFFTIKNYNEENKITETALKYRIEISSISDEEIDDNIKFELYEDGKKINLNNKKTDYIEISNKEKEKRKYELKVSYDDDKNLQKNIIQQIQVKVHTEQVKA